jgi:hypothetical protein
MVDTRTPKAAGFPFVFLETCFTNQKSSMIKAQTATYGGFQLTVKAAIIVLSE